MGIIKKLKSLLKIKSPYNARKVGSSDEELTFYFAIRSIKTNKFVKERKGSDTKLVDSIWKSKTFATKHEAEEFMVKNNMMPRYYRVVGYFIDYDKDGKFTVNIIDPSVLEPNK